MKKIIIVAAVIFSVSQAMAKGNDVKDSDKTNNNIVLAASITSTLDIRPLSVSDPVITLKDKPVIFSGSVPNVNINQAVVNRYKSLFWYAGRNIFA